MEGLHHRIILREATLADLHLLEHWDEQPHNIESDPNDDWNWAVELARFPDWREQQLAVCQLAVGSNSSCQLLTEKLLTD